MPSLPPHTRFFGNAVDADMELAFLRESVDSLEALLAEAAARPASEQAPLNDAVAAIAGDREYLYAELLPAVVHETHAISCIVFLERQCRDYVQSLAAAMSSTLAFNDLSGTVLERFKTYCEKVAGLQFRLSAQDWQAVRGLVWAPHSEIKRFKRSADFHRHARRLTAPHGALSLPQAHFFVRRIALAWLEGKAT